MKEINLKFLLQLILERKDLFIWGQLITIIAILFSVPIPLMLPALVDEVLLEKPDFFVSSINRFLGEGGPLYYIVIVAFSVVFLRFLHYVLSIFTTKIFTSISKYAIFKIRKRLLTHLKEVSMNEYENLGSGAVSANLITDVNTLDNFITTGASRFITAVLSLLAVGIVMTLIDPILGAVIIVIQPIVMLLSRRIAQKSALLKKEENHTISEFQQNIGETLELFGQIKASNKEEQFFENSISKAKDIQIASNNYSYKNFAYERFSFTMFLIIFEIFRAIGLILVAYSDLSIGMMFAMFAYIWFIMTPVQDILSMQYSYTNAVVAINRINKILRLSKEDNGLIVLHKDDKIDLEIKNLSFSYNENKEILKDISLKINSKDKVAFIGASGSGKSTLAQIIAGFYKKNSGQIEYNGISVEKIDKKSLRNRLFLVLQMPILFNNTLRFNITMGDETIHEEAILRALEISQLKEVVQDMKDGLDTVVGKNGVRLSGGQRQRLSIARMIIANPSVVIFDESTSALDANTETRLFNSLKPILEDKTVITIAHRLSTVKNANKIFVLDDGRIVQSGDHESLKEEDGHYIDFINSQLVKN